MSLSQYKVLIFDVYGTLVVRFIQTFAYNAKFIELCE